MSYPIQQYNSNNNALVDQKLDKAVFNVNDDDDDDIFRSFYSLANRLMGEMLSSHSGLGDISSFGSSDLNDPNVKVFGISSMNVTQISRGQNGRPHIVQAHNERRMGPGGIWQTKKALRDPDRGIDKMQVGYFVGNQGEIVERQLDPTTGQYRQEIKRRGLPSNEPNFSNRWRTQAQQAMQRPPPLSQQLPDQYPQQALPAPSNYNQYSQQALPVPSYYDQYSQQTPSYGQYSQQTPSYQQYPQQTGYAPPAYQYY
jgi:hypothetical protein